MITNGISLTLSSKSTTNPLKMVRKTDRFGVQGRKKTKELFPFYFRLFLIFQTANWNYQDSIGSPVCNLSSGEHHKK